MLNLVTSLLLATGASAHIALYHPSMFGINYPKQSNEDVANWNSNDAVWPQRADQNLDVSQWFGHGWQDYPPIPGDYLPIVSGGSSTFNLGCNRAFTNMRAPGNSDPLPKFACLADNGPLHNVNPLGDNPDLSLFGGTAISIAYTSDVKAVKPTDFTVISTNLKSPWTREATYNFPSGLPPCPEGGCICQWNWIHQKLHGEGYGEEIYSLLYRCQVSGSTNANAKLATPVPPVDCAKDSSKCVKGAKQPIYLFQKSGNNMPSPGGDENPIYSTSCGFTDGAQSGIFA